LISMATLFRNMLRGGIGTLAGEFNTAMKI